VGLAQALIADPDLLILDEPMSGLDPNQIVEIRQLIKKIGQEKTVIYCSHILSEVSATCTRIMIINDGSIVASGTADELMSSTDQDNRYVARIKAEQGAVEGAIAAVNGVSSTKIRGTKDNWHEVEIISDQKRDIGEDLFRCVVANGWSLAELKRETASLEDVFTQLTRG
jgi:ABC-2 type transport system ATP-binding protein